MTAPLNAVPAMISPESAPNESSRRDLQARLAGLGDLGGKKISPEAKAKKLREACEGFESVFIQKMWQEMCNTLPKNGLLHGREEQFWQDMYDQELSKKMTSAGGIGLADMMYEQLSRNLVSASRSAAGLGRNAAFSPSAAPLLPETPAAPAAEQPVAAAATGVPAADRVADAGRAGASVYDGVAPQMGVVDRNDAAGNGPVGDPAVRAGAALNASAQNEVEILSNPEVEQALASLRARQALNPPAQEKATTAHAGQGARQDGLSGLELARMAQREAGDKLGPNAVRPPLRHLNRPGGTVERHAVNRQTAPASGSAPQQASGAGESPFAAAAMAVQAATLSTQAVLGASPALNQAQGQNQEQAQTAEAAPQTRTVRYTTNIPQKGRSRRGQNLIRTLNADGTGPGSRAGAGLAAYHAAQAQSQAAQANADPAAAQSNAARTPAAQPAAPDPARTVPPLTARSGEEQGATTGGTAASFSIPPLTAGDLRG